MARSLADKLRKGAPVFAALGDETRLRIVAKLSRDGPMSITRITKGENVTRQAITKHLDVLEGAGLVRGVRSGRERLWELEPAPLDDAKRYLDLVSQQWDRALARLKEFVED